MAESGNAFDYQDPKRVVTMPDDPQGLLKGSPYPKHLYKYGGGKDSLIVAWDDDTPIHNVFVDVADAAAEDAAIAKGFGPGPILKAPASKK